MHPQYLRTDGGKQPDARVGIVAGGVSMAVLAVGLAVTVAGLPMAWLVWPVGYGVVLPLSIGYAARSGETDGDTAADTDQLATLQQRYVDGEVGEAEFERELDAVLSEDERR
jgi:uncharacterized membrane protein